MEPGIAGKRRVRKQRRQDGACAAASRRVRLGGEPRSPWPIRCIGGSPDCHIRRRSRTDLRDGRTDERASWLAEDMPVEKGFPAADPAESPSWTCRRHDRPQRDRVGVDFECRRGEPVLLSGCARPANALWLLGALRRRPNSKTCQTHMPPGSPSGGGCGAAKIGQCTARAIIPACNAAVRQNRIPLGLPVLSIKPKG